MTVTTLLAISLGAILTNNFIFAQFLGICPFLGVSKKIDTALFERLAQIPGRIDPELRIGIAPETLAQATARLQ